MTTVAALIACGAAVVVGAARRPRDDWTAVPRVRGPLRLQVSYPIDSQVGPGPLTVLGTTGSGAAEVFLDGRRARVADNGAFVALQPDSLRTATAHSLTAVLDGDTARITFGIRASATRAGRDPGTARDRAAVETGRPVPAWTLERLVVDATTDGDDGTSGSYLLLPGTQMWVTATQPDSLRVVLADGRQVWLPAKSFTRATPRAAPVATRVGVPSVTAVSEAGDGDRVDRTLKVILRTPAARSVLQVRATPEAVIITYRDSAGRAASDSGRRQLSADSRVDVQSRSRGTEREIVITPKARIVGYDVSGVRDSVAISMRRFPSRLSDVLVVLDPGHPPHGARGPSNTLEATLTMAIAQATRRALEANGVRTLLTHHSSHPMSLAARVRFVALQKPDIVVSIHADAAPDGIDPYTRAGTRTYFLYDQAAPLADAVQSALVTRLSTTDGGVGMRNLALTRITGAAAILCEVATLTIPEEEALLTSPDAREEAGRSIADGIIAFVRAGNEGAASKSAHGSAQ